MAGGPLAVNTLIDSLNIYVESFDYLDSSGAVGSVLTVTASATGTFTGADFTNTAHKGGMFFIGFTSIVATCTIRFMLQSKDPKSGLYLTIASLSLDGLTASNVTNGPVFGMKMYPGIGTAGAAQVTNYSDTFTRTMRVQASITATASAATPAASFTIGLSKTV